VFHLRDELKWSYKIPSLGVYNQCLLMGFMWNIKQCHTTNHKYAKPHYVLLDLEINILKEVTFSNSSQFCLGYILVKTITSSQGSKHVYK
jgi:hypothetical protein